MEVTIDLRLSEERASLVFLTGPGGRMKGELYLKKNGKIGWRRPNERNLYSKVTSATVH